MKLMNLAKRFKPLNLTPMRIIGFSFVLGLFITLPLFIWALVTQTFLFNKKAATGEPGVCLAVNKTIIVTDQYGTDPGTCHDIQMAIDAVTGDGYTIRINRGDYNITRTLYINNKSNLRIEGNVEGNIDEVWLSFDTSNRGGYGIRIENSSGSISRLHAEGITPNGLVSVQNSNNFSFGYTKLVGRNSHTFDAYNSSNINIYNSEIVSTAGALEFARINGLNISNNKIHNSDNAISAYDSSYLMVQGNLIYNNGESALSVSNINHLQVVNNTFTNNSQNYPGNGTVMIRNSQGNDYSFYRNIIHAGAGAGLQVVNGQQINVFNRNDVFGNNQNYSGINNMTGIDFNISSDPLLNADNFIYCPFAGSPVIFGEASNPNGYMGYIGVCATSPPNRNPPLCETNSIEPGSGPYPFTTTLYGAGSSGSGVGIDGYRWDFEGDGIWDTDVTLSPVTHTYNSPGVFNPQYQVHNVNNIWSQTCNYRYPVIVRDPNIRGDVNGDGLVNIVDIGIIIDNYRQPGSSNPFADLNSDGIINIVDIGIVVDNYHT